MSLPDFLIALFIGGIGLFLVGYLLWQLCGPLFGWLSSSRDLFRLRKALVRVNKADEYIRDGKLDLALRELERSFVLHVTNSRELINSVREHNQTILSRCLVVAEGLGGTFQNLPHLERLLLERAEIQLVSLKTVEAFRNIASKRGRAGKELPSWGKTDYQRRSQEIRRELEKNHKALEQAFQEFFLSIRTPVRHNVTYH